MSFMMSTRYYLYRSPWFMTFVVSNIALFFVFAAVIEQSIPPTILNYALLAVIVGLGIGAIGMGLEVAAELDE